MPRTPPLRFWRSPHLLPDPADDAGGRFKAVDGSGGRRGLLRAAIRLGGPTPGRAVARGRGRRALGGPCPHGPRRGCPCRRGWRPPCPAHLGVQTASASARLRRGSRVEQTQRDAERFPFVSAVRRGPEHVLWPPARSPQRPGRGSVVADRRSSLERADRESLVHAAATNFSVYRAVLLFRITFF